MVSSVIALFEVFAVKFATHSWIIFNSPNGGGQNATNIRPAADSRLMESNVFADIKPLSLSPWRIRVSVPINPNISWECRVLGKSQRVSLSDLSKSIAIAMVTGKSVEMAAEIFPKTA